MIYEIVPATREHSKYIAELMRPEDIQEIWASSRRKPFEALELGRIASRNTASTGLADGEPICMFGVSHQHLFHDRAVPWMLASVKLKHMGHDFLRQSRRILNIMFEEYPQLENYVDMRNTPAINWLRWAGFHIAEEPVMLGVDRIPFYRFYKHRAQETGNV